MSLSDWLSNASDDTKKLNDDLYGSPERKSQRRVLSGTSSLMNIDELDYYEKIILVGERPLSWNQAKKMHWTAWQREVRRCVQLIENFVGVQRQPFDFPVSLIVTAFVEHESGRLFDTTNVVIKNYEDGLVRCGLFADDSGEFVRYALLCPVVVDNEHPRVEIEIVSAGAIIKL